jgi:TfoX/Sxy family transcriptional regulator of competence genes
MAYDEELAERIRRVLKRRRGVAEKKMFGGLSFLVSGNMACGVVGKEICVRVGPDAYETALSHPHAREVDFTGKPLRGMVYVSAKGIRSDADLKTWVDRGLAHARSLPAK